MNQTYKQMITFPNSKINLGLNIVEKRPDGYHNLETIFYPIDLQDALEVGTLENCSQDYTLHVTGDPIDGTPEDNLVVKAYKLLKADYNLPAVCIYMYKHIPSGAGLGGGSSDAAFMIKLLNEKYHLNLTVSQMEKYASELGADCAFFIRNEPVFATGVGNVFEPVHISLKGYYILLVKPEIFVSTCDAYSMVIPVRPDYSLKEIITQPIDTWKENMVNDFEVSVFKKYPAIHNIKKKLYELGAVYAAMSGSGSCVYGIFHKQVADATHHFPNCFCRQRELSI